jgi:DNA-binding Lrp family transcriptional regulator
MLDAIDRHILKALQRDAKLNIKELAAELNMTKTPIYERIRWLEQEGVIAGYVAVVDRKKLAPSMMVFCSVSLDVQQLDKIQEFREAISEIPEVVECYLTGGVFDFLLKVVVRDLEAYHAFSSGKLATLPHVSQIKSSFVLDEIKHSTVMPVGE